MSRVSRRKFLKIAAAGAVVGSGGIAASAVHDTDDLEIVKREIPLRKWKHDGFRVLFLSDVHVDQDHGVERAIRAVETASKLDADVCLLGGDYLSLTHPAMLKRLDKFAESLADLPMRKFAVLGNHDFFSGESEVITEHLSNGGAHILRDDIARVQGVTIAGCCDGLYGGFDPSFMLEARAHGSVIALMHEPDIVDDMPDWLGLQLSGHSHGGQICLPTGYMLHTPRGARKYCRGYYADARVPLYVSRGVGTVRPDFRLFCRPEITVLTLRSG